MPPTTKRPRNPRTAPYTERYAIALDGPRQPRHHVVLLDGTWNDETGRPWTHPLTGATRALVTNLVKLDRALAPDTATQLVTYHRGIGNREDNTAVQRLFQGAFGADEACIRAGAYAQLVLDWKPGDIVSIFGFSRGAACARMLANDLARHGIPATLDVTRKLWNGEFRISRCSIPRGAPRVPVPVAFLGLWDTVGSFGVPLDIGPLPFGKINLGKDLALAPNVERAVHCVALDEDRTAYEVVPLAGSPEVVEEVWFAGVHSDIGGSYGFDGLGRLCCGFMVDRWEKHLATRGAPPLLWNESARAAALPSADEPLVRHHQPASKLPRRPRRLRTASGPVPLVHVSVSDLIGLGASPLVAADESAPPVLRHYNPPNLTARDPHRIVRD
jgi:hypothetical protein